MLQSWFFTLGYRNVLCTILRKFRHSMVALLLLSSLYHCYKWINSCLTEFLSNHQWHGRCLWALICLTKLSNTNNIQISILLYLCIHMTSEYDLSLWWITFASFMLQKPNFHLSLDHWNLPYCKPSSYLLPGQAHPQNSRAMLVESGFISGHWLFDLI